MATYEELQAECQHLRRRLTNQNDLQVEMESVKSELEQALDAHKRLQEVALALEEENRTVQEKYKIQLRDSAKLDELKLDLENEVETKKLNFENLEKRFTKMKEKATTYENLEDLAYSLEKDKRRNTEKIKELEEELEVTKSGTGTRNKEKDKLTKENTELALKLETYMDEMEEMDTKVEQLENENKELKKNFDRVKSIELVGSNITELTELEADKEELEAKLKKEIAKRETVENELFKIEEEYENLKISQEESEEKVEAEIAKINKDLLGRKVSTESMGSSSADYSNNEMGMKFLLKKKQKLLDSLEKENNKIKEKVKALEQEHDILLDENSTLAKANMQMDDQLNKIKTRYDSKMTQLQDQLENMEEKRKTMEQENFDRLVTSAEKEYEYSQRYQDNNREVERVKGELKVIQEYLRLATDKNSELQIELDDVKRELYQKLNEQQNLTYQHKQLERAFSSSQEHNNNVETSSTSSVNSQESSEKTNILQRMALKYDEEKEEYEGRLHQQNNVIKSLEERIISLRSFYDRKTLHQSNGTLSSTETTPPVAIKNGRLHDSMDELNVYRRKSVDFSDDELDCGDTVSDRQLRRISYRIADGNWKYLPNELNFRHKQDANQILNSQFNDQEKVYRLLVCWRSEHDLPREDFLKQLIERVGSKRKDVVKFLKEMAGISSKDGAIKTRFQKFKKSVKR